LPTVVKLFTLTIVLDYPNLPTVVKLAFCYVIVSQKLSPHDE